MGLRGVAMVALVLASCEFHHGALSPDAAIDGSGSGSGSGTGSGTAMFQQGVNGYAGTQDTFMDEASPTTTHGAQATFEFDLDANNGKPTVGLLRFDSIFTAIPLGSKIDAATVTIDISGGGTTSADLHPALVDWSETTVTWSNFGGDSGVQSDEIGATSGQVPFASGVHSFDATSSVAAWSQGTANFGWVLIATSTDGVDVVSSEDTQPASRPMLVVSWHR